MIRSFYTAKAEETKGRLVERLVAALEAAQNVMVIFHSSLLL
jgi:uncharacterized Ntn-hydrolase superfamily protein